MPKFCGLKSFFWKYDTTCRDNSVVLLWKCWARYLYGLSLSRQLGPEMDTDFADPSPVSSRCDSGRCVLGDVYGATRQSSPPSPASPISPYTSPLLRSPAASASASTPSDPIRYVPQSIARFSPPAIQDRIKASGPSDPTTRRVRVFPWFLIRPSFTILTVYFF